jgi:hypothetical protein
MAGIIYVVMAYRFGEYDNHSYVVAVDSNRGRAKRIGKEENDMRGGKYAVEVTSWTPGTDCWHNGEVERVAFYPANANPDKNTLVPGKRL